MGLEYPLMLFKPGDLTIGVASQAERDEKIAAGWYLRADAWFLRGEAPPEPVAPAPVEPVLPKRKPRKAKERE